MDSTRYVQIPCHVCGGKSLAIGGQPRPSECVHCKSPLDRRTAERSQPSGARPSDPATRTPAAFTRGTFTHSPPPTQKPRPAPATRPTPKSRTVSHDPTGGLKDRLLRLFAHRG